MGKPRFSAAARGELIHWLTRYRDSVGTPITLVFDGSGGPKGLPNHESTPEFEILFSKDGRTADDLIERATHRLLPFGEVLVVTDDFAERDTVSSLGGMAWSCETFIRDVHSRLEGMEQDLAEHNRREWKRFKKRD